MSLELARQNMIEQQIRTWDVLDERVLALYRNDVLLRENFIATDKTKLAYADFPLPLAEGQTMLEPKLEARMLQTLALQGNEKVLHIGCGSGYFAALLGQLTSSVISLEIRKTLAKQATKNLAGNYCTNVEVRCLDGITGLPDNAPYDIIVLTGSVPHVNPALFTQLAMNGKLLAIVGNAPAMTLYRYTKIAENSIIKKGILETNISSLDDTNADDPFQF